MHCFTCFHVHELKNTLFVSCMSTAQYTYYDVWTDTLQETDIFGSSATLTEVLGTSSSNQPQFELMTLRLWTALSCPWDTRLTTELYGILKRNVGPTCTGTLSLRPDVSMCRLLKMMQWQLTFLAQVRQTEVLHTPSPTWPWFKPMTSR